MPDQPPDPIHYDMKIPPEPKDQQAEEQESAKKHGDKLNTGTTTSDTNPQQPGSPREQNKGDS